MADEPKPLVVRNPNCCGQGRAVVLKMMPGQDLVVKFKKDHVLKSFKSDFFKLLTTQADNYYFASNTTFLKDWNKNTALQLGHLSFVEAGSTQVKNIVLRLNALHEEVVTVIDPDETPILIDEDQELHLVHSFFGGDRGCGTHMGQTECVFKEDLYEDCMSVRKQLILSDGGETSYILSGIRIWKRTTAPKEVHIWLVFNGYGLTKGIHLIGQIRMFKLENGVINRMNVPVYMRVKKKTNKPKYKHFKPTFAPTVYSNNNSVGKTYTWTEEKYTDCNKIELILKNDKNLEDGCKVMSPDEVAEMIEKDKKKYTTPPYTIYCGRGSYSGYGGYTD